MSLEARTKQPRASKKHPRSRDANRPELPRYDQALRNAKNEQKRVKFQLSDVTYFTDEECTVIGLILEVDKFDICINTYPSDTINTIGVWIKKSHIVATEVL